MPKYLLAAEADQIQDIVFRVSRLRDVVGGSQLLSRFCRRGARWLLEKHGGVPERDVIIGDGGAFRIWFDDSQMASDYGRDLAELYRRCVGGRLTVAEPVPSDGNAFEAAQAALRAAKSRGHRPAGVAHLPYLAFCASCGLALATDHQHKLREEDPADRPDYLCTDCAHKTGESYRYGNGFLNRFRREVLKQLPIPLKQLCLKNPPGGDWTEAIGQLDPRRYVAYLIADGNGMGQLFDRCPEDRMKELSDVLGNELRTSLAAPCAALLEHQTKVQENATLPVLPLILGGDDLFALVPAPWAVDFATRLCTVYEDRLAGALNDIPGLEGEQPTVAVAVVICKANYPHTLAHRRGKAELDRAKRLVRRVKALQGRSVSLINVAVISGNQVGGQDATGGKGWYRSTLAPYLARESLPPDWGCTTDTLVDLRWQLRRLPGKRRAELERLYAQPPTDSKDPQEADDLKRRWLPEFAYLQKRIGRSTEADGGVRDTLREAMERLGDPEVKAHGYWRDLRRPEIGSNVYGHGLPDLLALWDYAFRLDKARKDYEED